MRRRYLPITSYLAILISTAIVPVLVTAYMSLSQAAAIEQQANRQILRDAYTEFDMTLADIERSLLRIGTSLSHWDETTQNFSDSTYYRYWRENRLHDAALVEAALDSVELYRPDGTALDPDNNISAQVEAASVNQTVLTMRRGIPYITHVLPVYPAADITHQRPPQGFIAIQADLNQFLSSAESLNRSDHEGLVWNLKEGQQVPLSDATKHIQLSVFGSPGLKSLARLVHHSFIEHLVFSTILIVLFSLLLVFSLGRPLQLLAQHIKKLHDGAAEGIPETIQIKLGVTELEHVRQAVNEYRDKFHSARDSLIEKNLELERLTYRDSLTGVFNRRAFESHVKLALQSAKLESRHHILCYMDLDQFKVVNDTCGHTAGDQMLKQVTACLQSRLRETDILARLGGDEFGVLLENCKIETALRIAEQLRETIKNYRFAWEGKMFDISVSIGLVEISPDVPTPEDVLRDADSACYMAKDLGRNRVQVYQMDDEVLVQRTTEMHWVSHITRALEDNRMVLHSQMIAPIDRNESAGLYMEILVRMYSEDGELIAPMAFLPAAERYGLVKDIDRWVIREACDLLQQYLPGLGDTPPHIAVNLSGPSLGDASFLDFVMEQLTRPHLSPRHFCFEITETAAITHLVSAKHFIKELRAKGCRFSLDDFGSGLSSFASLKNLQVDCLKIDGHFVKNMADDPIDHAMVESINQIGHIMGMRTIGEFVENERILAALRAIGVDFAQGYGIAKPEPFEAVLKRMTRERLDAAAVPRPAEISS